MTTFDRFTERARMALKLSEQEARRLNHGHVGTEHLLLGLLGEGVGIPAQTLSRLGVTLPKARTSVELIIGRGDVGAGQAIGLTPRAKAVLEFAVEESRQLGHDHVAPHHLLLGLIREGEGVGAQILTRAGAELDDVRVVVLELLSGRGRPEAADQVPAPHTTLSPQARAKALAVLGSLGPKAKRQTSKLAVKPKPSKPAAKAPRKRPAAKRPPRKTG